MDPLWSNLPIELVRNVLDCHLERIRRRRRRVRSAKFFLERNLKFPRPYFTMHASYARSWSYSLVAEPYVLCWKIEQDREINRIVRTRWMCVRKRDPLPPYPSYSTLFLIPPHVY